MDTMSRVVVTGASGLIGTHLVRLIVESTVRVVECWVRRDSAAKKLRALGPEERLVIRCAANLGELTLPPDTGVVIHGASPTNHWDVEGAIDANLGLTWRMLDALSGRDMPARLVYMSTLLLRGNSPRPFSEEDLDVGQAFLTPYAQAKFLAETALRTTYVQGVDTTSLRIGGVMWPRGGGELPERNWLCQSIRLWRRGQLPIVPLPDDHLFYPIPVDELCALIWQAASTPEVPRVLHIPAESGPTLGSVFAGLANGADQPPPRLCHSDSDDWTAFLESLPHSVLRRRLTALFPVPPKGARLAPVDSRRSRAWIEKRGLTLPPLTDAYWVHPLHPA